VSASTKVDDGPADLRAMLDGDPGPEPGWEVTPSTPIAGARGPDSADVRAAEGTRPEIRVETLRELRDRPAEPLPTVGGRRLPRSEICSIAARAGRGKTTIVRGVLAHSSAGRPYLGFDFAAPIRSVYFSGEGSAPLWRQAMLGVTAAFGIEDDSLERIAVVEGGGPTGLKLNRPDDLDRIRGILEKLKAAEGLDLAVFDPFQRFAPGDENSSRDMGAAVDALLELGREFDVALLVPHHASQSGKGLDAFRGHTTFEGAIATGLVLTATESGDRILEAPKVRYAASASDARTILLDFDAEARIYTERPGLGAKTKSGRLLELLEDGAWHKAKDLAEGLGAPASTFRDGYLNPAVELGLIDRQKGPKNAVEVRLHDAAATLEVGA
jgi:AAA domain